MKKKKIITLLIIAILIITAGAAAYWFFIGPGATKDQADQTTVSEADKPASDKDIATVIESTGGLSSFKNALVAAGLTETLKGVGPYTVIAPSNVAFNAMPSGSMERFLKPENLAQLLSIMNYHIVSGEVLTSQLVSGQKLKTVNGQEVVAELADSNVYFIDAKGNKALVTKSDVKTKNGVIHIVDAVLLPQ